MSDFLDKIKQEVKERLPNYLGQFYYPCDLGSKLTENENCNGSWYCSAYEAKEDIRKYLDEYGEYQTWYHTTYGEVDWFESEPDDYHHSIESVHCRMMICAVENCFDAAFNAAFGNSDIWNENTEINQEFIDKINKGLEEVDEIW